MSRLNLEIALRKKLAKDKEIRSARPRGVKKFMTIYIWPAVKGRVTFEIETVRTLLISVLCCVAGV